VNDDFHVTPFRDPEVQDAAHQADEHSAPHRRPESLNHEPFDHEGYQLEEQRVDDDHEEAQGEDDERKREKIQEGSDHGVQQREHDHGGNAGRGTLHLDAGDDRGGQEHGNAGDHETD